MRRLTNTLMTFISMLMGMGLLLSYLSVYISPASFWMIGLVGLAYPFLLLVNIALLTFWIVRWRWEFIIPLFAIMIGINHLSNFFQFPFGKSHEANGPTIKVLTYNVNLFQLFPWASKPPTHNQILEFLQEQNPDIITLQEFYEIEGQFTRDEVMDNLGYYLHIGHIVRRRGSSYGMATLSRYPIVNTGEIKFESTANACIYSDIAIGDDTIRVYNSHLQSLRLRERNLNYLINQDYMRENVNNFDEIRDISFRYRDAIIKRAEQVDRLTAHILSCPYPVILCGDFNDSPISYSYRRLSQRLNDSFVEAGSGVGYTYRELSLSFRIDYILYSSHFRAVQHSIPQVTYSDHYPVVARLEISF